jgi:hypothetical protein
MNPKLQQHIARFAKLMNEAEAERRFLKTTFGLSDVQIGTMAQGKKSALTAFAEAALAAKPKLKQRRTP